MRRDPSSASVVAVAGLPASGRTTIANFIAQQFGFQLLSLAGVNDKRVETSFVVDGVEDCESAIWLRDQYPQLRLIWVTAPRALRDRRSGGEVTDPSPDQLGRIQELRDLSDAIIMNIDIEDTTTQVAALLLKWIHGSRRPTALVEMIEAVTRFHRKHGFAVGTGDSALMHYRMGLFVEELGELNECISKGTGDIAQEHADLLILLLGNAVTLGLDLERAFWKKYARIMRRKSKIVDGTVRVSEWNGKLQAVDSLGYYPLSGSRLLDGANAPVPSAFPPGAPIKQELLFGPE